MKDGSHLHITIGTMTPTALASITLFNIIALQHVPFLGCQWELGAINYLTFFSFAPRPSVSASVSKKYTRTYGVLSVK